MNQAPSAPGPPPRSGAFYPAARAPGKVVLSGAYAVLEGAPAVVAAVDRYAVADASGRAEFVTPEVAEALGSEAAPRVDASALRSAKHKLGLGSSAAILVASLGAVTLKVRGPVPDQQLRELVFERALSAHARAQGGGSGIDVVASTYGGILLVQRTGGRLAYEPTALPPGVWLEVWASDRPASTPELLRLVEGLRQRDPARYRRAMAAQAAASERAAAAFSRRLAADLVQALNEQERCLEELGALAGAPIVTEQVSELNRQANLEQATVLPSGAGGGDIALYVGLNQPSKKLRELAARLGHHELELELGATGLEALHGGG